ncbi:MAG: class I SAM-dependent methyltransferase, partial [Actinomycetota bacterium]
LASLHPSFGVGADSSSRMVEQAKRRHPNLSFVCADVEEMPISGAFDYVVACNLVGYLSDVWTCFRNLSQVTSPSTRILITHYNFVWEPVLKLASRLGLKSDEPLQNWL